MECRMANVEGRIYFQAFPFCICSNTVSTLRGQENASFAPCLLNTACHKLIFLIAVFDFHLCWCLK